MNEHDTADVASRIANGFADLLRPLLEAAVADELEGQPLTVATLTVERGDTLTTTVYCTARPTNGNADLNIFLNENSLPAPKVRQ